MKSILERRGSRSFVKKMGDAMSGLMKNKRGQADLTGMQIVIGLVAGVGSLIFTVILIFVLVQTIVNANLLTANSLESNATDRLRGNFTEGIDNVSLKIPTILLIGAVVVLFGALALLVFVARRMGFLGGGSGGL